MLHLYYQTAEFVELIFCIDTDRELTQLEMLRFCYLIEQPGVPYKAKHWPTLEGNVVTIGPLMHFETTLSRRQVDICQKAGLTGVKRIEVLTRYQLSPKANQTAFIKAKLDRTTQAVYESPIETFETGVRPELTQTIALLENGIVEVETVGKAMGLGLNKFKVEHLYKYFAEYEKRNATDVEFFASGQLFSEHCRHGLFGAELTIDGMLIDEVLFEIVKASFVANKGRSNRAFNDDACSIEGYYVDVLEPLDPRTSSEFVVRRIKIHPNCTAESHNYPTAISSFAGALTGIIGMLRDSMGQGRGSQSILVLGGYLVAGPRLSDFVDRPADGYWTDEVQDLLVAASYSIPGEKYLPLAKRFETPETILITGSDAVADGANKYGKPVTGGFCRAVDIILPDGTRYAYVKPGLYVGALGMIKDAHLVPVERKAGMKIVMIGNMAFRVGKGGGARSSVLSTTVEDFELDMSGVQRGDPAEQNGVYRVVRACTELNEDTPIVVIDDQGAAGVGGVLLEMLEKAGGGTVHVRQIRVGDKTMSVLEIVSCEYQERMAFVIYEDRIDDFVTICKREDVHCELLGEITGDGRVVFIDDWDGSKPVDLDMQKFMTELPQEKYDLVRVDHHLVPLVVPPGLTAEKAFEIVCQQLSVGSKKFLTAKGDQTVGGQVAQQQCCGPMQIPVSDVSVGALSMLGIEGAAMAVGENPLKILVNAPAGTRMVIAESIMNLVAANISALEEVSYRANWYAAAKLPGEGPIVYDVAISMKDFSIKVKIRQTGGKDSFTGAELIDGEFVKVPVSLMIYAYATVPDVLKVATPDIKKPGKSNLILLNPAEGRCRLGGSALALALDGQIGNECPDIDNIPLFVNTMKAVLRLHEEDLLLSYHDRIGDGGLMITLAEMAMASNCGMTILLDSYEDSTALERLFAEEAGAVIECACDQSMAVTKILDEMGVIYELIGMTRVEPKVSIRVDGEKVFDMPTGHMRKLWERTSYEIERRQMGNPACADQEFALYETMPAPQLKLTFEPKLTPEILMRGQARPRAAILRTFCSNSDREMAAAFHLAGFRTQDVSMNDLRNRVVSLKDFNALSTVGGFSRADAFRCAVGWASEVIYDPFLKEMFYEFYIDPGKFSYHECNGNQFAVELGWLPSMDLPKDQQPRMIDNVCRKFRHLWPLVEIMPSNSAMFNGKSEEDSMVGSRLIIPSAHGEGQYYFPDQAVLDHVLANGLAPVRYVEPDGGPTDIFPYSPNGSVHGIAALCSLNGNHTGMMPHSTRAFLKYQCRSWMPHSWTKIVETGPWQQMFQNLRYNCDQS